MLIRPVLPTQGRRGPLHTRSGPGTAGRIILFLGLAILLALPLAMVGFPGLLGSHLPLLVAGLLSGWFVLGLEGRGPGALGFPLGRGALEESALGIAAGTGVVVVTVGLITAAGGIEWAPGSGGGGVVVGQVMWVLVILAVPAAGEEVLLRGYLFQASAEAWGWGWTLAWTSVGFAILHGANPGVGPLALVNLTLAGVALGLIVLRTGSLWWATGAHLGWNWGQAALGLPVSGLGLVEDPWVAPEVVGAAWRGGGGFGVEGAAACTVVLAATSVWLWRGGGASWIRPGPAVLTSGSPVLEGEARRVLARKGLIPPGPNRTN